MASGIIAGAIRWDAWYARTSPALDAQASLGPSMFRYRAPVHAVSTSPYTISCVGTQAVMDAEIAAAVSGGLKYWAFFQPIPSNPIAPMDVAWSLYQSSTHKGDISSVWMSAISFFGSTGSFSTQMDLISTTLQQSNNLKITVSTANRPVWIIRWSAANFTSQFGGSYPNMKAAIDYLRASVVAAGFGTPYIIVMDGGTATNAAIVAGIGADAVSSYIPGFTSTLSGTFAALSTQTQAWWVTEAAAGVPIVPTAICGWDRRPRIAQPKPWEVPGQKALIGMNNYFAEATNAELVTHLGTAVTYITANASIVPSTLLLIYSWNECDEGGGCLTPSIGDPTGSRLAAIKATIN